MVKENKYRKITWIDIENPTKFDVDQIIEKYSVHPLVGEELLQPTVRPRVDAYNNFIYLILHFPNKSYNSEKSEQQIQEIEIDFIIGKDFLITTHYTHSDVLHDFEKKLETSVILEKARIGEHAGILFFYMLRELYRNMQEDLDVMSTSLKSIEKKIFYTGSDKLVYALAKMRRQLIDFKQLIRFHGDILRSFNEEGRKFFGVDFSHHLAYITSEYWKAYNTLEGHRETLGELRETHHLILTTRTNKIMKTVSVLALIAVPVMIVVQIIGSGVLSHYFTNDGILMLLIAATVILSVGLSIYFRYKKWI